MITCYLRYIIDPFKLEEFEHYGKLWIPLVEKFGGRHHGYFLPSEGANNVALAMFTFPSLAIYEQYRIQSFEDPACQAPSSSPKTRAASSATSVASSGRSSNRARSAHSASAEAESSSTKAFA